MSTHGYVPYRPTSLAKSVLTAAKNVLAEYEAWDSPMTVRQVFYRLVAEYGYEKTERAYGSLITYIARSRRAYQHAVLEADGDETLRDEALQSAPLIPFPWIRDEKGQSVQESSYDDEADFLKTVRAAAEHMKLDRMEGQPRNIELWCEAAGMVPLMAEIAEPYGIRISSGGGYDSVTAKHRLCQRALIEKRDKNRSTLVLHIGDFDPSGEGMFETLRDDVGQMVENYNYHATFEVKRVALTEEQVIDWNVETAPPKRQDSRRRRFVAQHPRIRAHLGSDDITAQLEALTPPDLRRLMEDAIDAEIHRGAYNALRAKEEKVRKALIERLKP